MKRVLANVLVAAILTGCSSASNPTPTGTGGNGAVPRGGETNWPQPTTTPPAVHRPYPLVLAHGFSGFHNIGPLNYFYGVQDALSKDGHLVFVTTVDPYNSSEARGAELLTQVQAILGETG
jgi:triacylglycerol lipase